MRTAVTAAQGTIRLTGATQVGLGLLLWSGRAPAVRQAHMLIGMTFVLALWALALLAARAGRARGLVALATGWGLLIPVFGITHSRLLPGEGHWVVRLLHLGIGIVAMVLAARLAQATRVERVGVEREGSTGPAAGVGSMWSV